MAYYPKFPRWICPDRKCGANLPGHQLFTSAADWRSSKPPYPCQRCGKARVLVNSEGEMGKLFGGASRA